MITCTYRENGSECTTEDYESNPDKFRGLIDCTICGKKAWFVKGYSTDKINRMACFGAKHAEGCDASTVFFSNDDIDEDKDGEASTDLKVDLDKTGTNPKIMDCMVKKSHHELAISKLKA